ncbi:MAG: GntR family transcriptional regulator [Deltaproteobacteria bacterium]|nr:MAG: GntR family transcriptional regulator [Deltaproteobacteria bacterium]
MKVNLLTLTSKVYLTVKNRILTGVYQTGEKIPRVEDLAEEFGVNLNTVKHALAQLKEEGLIIPVRKAGTKVADVIPPEKRELYLRVGRQMSLLVEELTSAGFSLVDAFACFTGSVEEAGEESKIYYVDSDSTSLLEGKRELEEHLGCRVNPILAKELEAVARVKGVNEPGTVVVTTFALEEKVKSVLSSAYVVPLRTTPPLDQIIDSKNIPSTAPLYVVARDEDEKALYRETYGFLKDKHPLIVFCSVEELETGEVVPKPGGIFVMSRYIYRQVENYLKSAHQVIAFGKFTDPDGLNYVREGVSGGTS